MLISSFAGQLSDNTTLFTYKPGESTSTFSNASFVPIFLDEPIHFASTELKKEAERACQGDMNCLLEMCHSEKVLNKSLCSWKVKLKPWVSKMSSFPSQEMLYVAARLFVAPLVEKGNTTSHWITLTSGYLRRFRSSY